MSGETLDRLRADAESAAASMAVHHSGERALAPLEINAALVALGLVVAATWERYHASLSALPVVATSEELAALYRDHNEAVARLARAMLGERPAVKAEPLPWSESGEPL